MTDKSQTTSPRFTRELWGNLNGPINYVFRDRNRVIGPVVDALFPEDAEHAG